MRRVPGVRPRAFRESRRQSVLPDSVGCAARVSPERRVRARPGRGGGVVATATSSRHEHMCAWPLRWCLRTTNNQKPWQEQSHCDRCETEMARTRRPSPCSDKLQSLPRRVRTGVQAPAAVCRSMLLRCSGSDLILRTRASPSPKPSAELHCPATWLQILSAAACLAPGELQARFGACFPKQGRGPPHRRPWRHGGCSRLQPA
jgi:hypothetical protein